LLSHVPAEDFAATVRWACYDIGHEAVRLNKQKGHFTQEIIPVGKEIPPHAGDRSSTLYKDLAHIQSRSDRQLQTSTESLPCLFLKRLPKHLKHVYLTAEVLITMRQALNSPSLSADDHLMFQGVDAAAGAQLMEIIGSELDHRLPLDWPKVCGTVASLATQASTHMNDLKADLDKSVTKPKKKTKGSKGKKEKGKAVKEEPSKAKEEPSKAKEQGEEQNEASEGGTLSHFNRAAILRIMQQVGYFMVDQDHITKAVLAQRGEDVDDLATLATTGMKDKDDKKPRGVRQSRFVAVTDRLFQLADSDQQDHTSFVLAVVVYHMVLRGLMMRVQYHRSAIALQKRYRYLKTGNTRRQQIAPAIIIQRFWRGLGTRLRMMYMDDAAAKIQHNFRAWRWNRNCRRLLNSVMVAQRVFKGALVRMWLRRCRRAATLIQKNVRRMLTSMVLNKKGRELIRSHKQVMSHLAAKRGEMTESMFVARSAALAAKARIAMARFRDTDLGIRRSASFSIKSAQARKLDKQKKLKLKGNLQPIRTSVFEPIPFALRRQQEKERKKPARYGAPLSKVAQTVRAAKLKMERAFALEALPDTRVRDHAVRSHAAAKAGRRAKLVRRQTKQPKLSSVAQPEALVDTSAFDKWMNAQFNIRR